MIEGCPTRPRVNVFVAKQLFLRQRLEQLQHRLPFARDALARLRSRQTLILLMVHAVEFGDTEVRQIFCAQNFGNSLARFDHPIREMRVHVFERPFARRVRFRPRGARQIFCQRGQFAPSCALEFEKTSACFRFGQRHCFTSTDGNDYTDAPQF